MSNDIRKAHKMTHRNVSSTSNVPINVPTNIDLSTIFEPQNTMPTSALDVISRIQDKNLQNEYAFNYYGIKDQQAFAERMARNSYQYAVEDLRKAGLNPYMLYTNGGSGATTPSTSAYSASPYAGVKYTADKNYEGVKLSSKVQLSKSLLDLVGSLAKSATLLIGS